MIFFTICHIICYDLWFYISHIGLHNKYIYNHIHKIHHAKPYIYLEFKDTHVSHYLENVVQPLGIIIPYFFYTFQFYPLLLSFLIISIRGLARHDHRCSWLLGNHHILHHKHLNCNYGEYWIDKLFGTVYKEENEYIYGILYT